ncbi:diguanylate cyclase domain-containing protein [Paenibacillus sp. GCM10023252]|uniref:sensor domain-containing diguanylate cyclase n=1 Tax=Paenibacillus sp. GCM10023252 TaxID=3252649 RepID=UPI00361F87B6
MKHTDTPAHIVPQRARDMESIWFMNEDIRDSDNPYLPELLHKSFKRWMAELEDSEWLTHTCVHLYTLEGQRIACSGIPKHHLDEFIRDELVKSIQRDEFPSSKWNLVHAPNLDTSIMVVPVLRRSDQRPFCLLVQTVQEDSVSSEALVAAALHYRSCFYYQFEQQFIREMLQEQVRTKREASHRDSLFLVAKQLYDQTDVASLLAEMLRSLETLYPESELFLYLSQDFNSGDNRVQPIVFRSASHDLVTKSFLEGRSITESEHGRTKLAVPMSGKQAVYGVLCLTIGQGGWDPRDLPAIVLLADTAGSAFENAKLYEQSNLLINELRLINELTKRLNQSLRPKEIYDFAATELLTIFTAEFCSVLQLDETSGHFQVMSTNVPAMAGARFALENGFCGSVYRTGEPLIVSDYTAYHEVKSEWMEHTAARSLIASPILVEGRVAGVILVGHRLANYFSYENYKLLQVMSTHIGLAVTNGILHAEVRRMVITDNLTGLYARHYLNEQITALQRKDPHGSLILVDIDHFKQVNDTYGHQVGDRILIQVAQIIGSASRQGDICARWGGEELAVYLPGIRTDTAFRIAERIRSRVELETDPSVTVSCGVSEWTYENEKVSVESLFYRADMALYEAKNNGRNCIYVGQGIVKGSSEVNRP